MKCECGNDTFSAHQVCHHDVLVNGSGEYADDKGVYYGHKPFGPFTCTACGKEYDELTKEAS